MYVCGAYVEGRYIYCNGDILTEGYHGTGRCFVVVDYFGAMHWLAPFFEKLVFGQQMPLFGE